MRQLKFLILKKYTLKPDLGGGGVLLDKIGWGCAAGFLKPLPYFTKICDFLNAQDQKFPVVLLFLKKEYGNLNFLS